jgi:hypothetical protein
MSSQAIVDREETQSGGAHVTGGQNVSAVCESTDCAGESSPFETFSLLANEDRLAILKAVVHADERGETPLSFSSLRETVDIRDSGRFSYHLQELPGHLLTRSADGYSLHEDCCDRLVAVVASIDI